MMSTSLATHPKDGVMPVERPTVPKAETSSNRSWRKVYSGSRMHSKKVQAHTSSRDSMVMRNALARASMGMLRRKALMCRLVKRLRTSCISTKKVVVLIPPPVDPGEAPMA